MYCSYIAPQDVLIGTMTVGGIPIGKAVEDVVSGFLQIEADLSLNVSLQETFIPTPVKHTESMLCNELYMMMLQINVQTSPQGGLFGVYLFGSFSMHLGMSRGMHDWINSQSWGPFVDTVMSSIPLVNVVSAYSCCTSNSYNIGYMMKSPCMAGGGHI